MLTQERLKELLHYAPETGVFTWLVNLQGGVKAGTRAGSVQCREGRRSIKINGRRYQETYLAFLYMLGRWPKLLVDHRDGDPTNNRWSNLREATRSQNMANSRKRKLAEVGLKGVTKVGNRFKAQIAQERKVELLGFFATAEEAHAAYCARATELYGEFFRVA